MLNPFVLLSLSNFWAQLQLNLFVELLLTWDLAILIQHSKLLQQFPRLPYVRVQNSFFFFFWKNPSQLPPSARKSNCSTFLKIFSLINDFWTWVSLILAPGIAYLTLGLSMQIIHWQVDTLFKLAVVYTMTMSKFKFVPPAPKVKSIQCLNS